MSSERGLLVVLSGPSGVGKSTVAARLIERYGYKPSISVTTRAPRRGEVNGRDYRFADLRSYSSWRSEGRFLECAEVHGNFYGTLRQPILDSVDAGETIILVIDVQGGASVRGENLPQISVFLEPPSLDDLRRRLASRSTDREEVIRMRMLRAVEEMEFRDQYDFRVVNDDLEGAVEKVHQIVEDHRRG